MFHKGIVDLIEIGFGGSGAVGLCFFTTRHDLWLRNARQEKQSRQPLSWHGFNSRASSSHAQKAQNNVQSHASMFFRFVQQSLARFYKRLRYFFDREKSVQA